MGTLHQGSSSEADRGEDVRWPKRRTSVVEIADGTGDTPNSAKTTPAQPPGHERPLENRRRLGLERGVLVEGVTGEISVAPDPTARGQITNLGHAFGDFGTGIAGRAEQGSRIGAIDPDHEIKPVKQGTRHPTGIAGARRRWAATRKLATHPARTRIHGRHDQNPGGLHRRAAGAGDTDDTLFERLPEGIEHRGGELPKFVKEEHATRGRTDLTGASSA